MPILLILILLLLLGALPTWPYSHDWGYYPSGGLGVVLVILLIVVLWDGADGFRREHGAPASGAASSASSTMVGCTCPTTPNGRCPTDYRGHGDHRRG